MAWTTPASSVTCECCGSSAVAGASQQAGATEDKEAAVEVDGRSKIARRADVRDKRARTEGKEVRRHQ
ncbi:hypothetical protein GN958_ATG04513 [Phytophthora infestans]|uniref:Uncharacterized protein n=1 Tax=Phytophthora infestans TaxID=4787 RepID=A0A8S9V2N6_PHYIN|nr:hypothetical protein GN958_ATG04513 [Phytophthora infestans]